ncbi:MAG TPA: hypothetical protein VN903_38460 [Polyangia bacterium]|nr:hypothetical protein [Polyangia bacterium]
MKLSRATSIVVLALSAGCAPSLSTMQPAHVAPKGHMQVTTAFEVGIPTGTIGRIIDSGRTLSDIAQANGSVTPDQERQLFDSGVTVAVSPPAVGYHFAAYYVPLDRLEVGLRYAGGGFRAGARYQFLRHETDPLDLTLGAGIARSTYEIPLASYIPILEIEDFTRYTIDVPLQIGTSRSYYRVWGGPKFLYSHYSTAIRLSLPSSPDLATFEGSTIYYGGQVGFAVGYKYVFVAFELTLAGLSGTAEVQTAPDPRNGEMLARNVDINGFIIYPAFGLIGEF